MPVSDTSNADDGASAGEDRVIGLQPPGNRRNAQTDASLLGEFERVGEQVLEHLLQPLGVGDQAASHARIVRHFERKLAVFRLVTEGPRDGFEQRSEEDLFRFDRYGARFDLGKIENVADEVEQVGSGAMNGARKLDLLRREAAVGVLGELLAQHENGVERRAQLVRHVGQEFRFVLGREGQLAGLFFQRAAGLLDFLVLAFHFVILFGELLRFLRELLVSLLQLLLLRLQFGGELLRLLQQAFGLHRGFDGVEHDADGRRELLEKREVRRGEGARDWRVR